MMAVCKGSPVKIQTQINPEPLCRLVVVSLFVLAHAGPLDMVMMRNPPPALITPIWSVLRDSEGAATDGPFVHCIVTLQINNPSLDGVIQVWAILRGMRQCFGIVFVWH